MTETERVIARMLKENTGSSMLDSGGAYGRHWERNQKRSFAKEPDVKLEVSTYIHTDKETGKVKESVELSPTISVFHFLSEALEYSSKEDRKFQAFARRAEFSDTGWLQIAEKYASENWGEPTRTFNSYNGEDWLSQVIQGVIAGEYEGFVLIQIHGGCDVRGGYTRPRVFRYSHDWGRTLADNAQASIFCQSKHGWTIEPGYSQGWNEEPALDSFPSHVLADGELPVPGKLCGRDNEAYCPLCATKLDAGF